MLINSEVDTAEKIYEGYSETTKGEMAESVSRYAKAGLNFPCLVIKKGFNAQKHRWILISNIVKSSKKSDVGLYLDQGDKKMKLGTVGGSQVRTLIEILGEDNLSGYYDDGRELVGSKLFVLGC